MLSPTISLSNFSEVTSPDCSTPPSPNNPSLDLEASQESTTTQDDLTQGLVRSSSFYFEEDMVEIRVENTLFRIPRIFLTLQSEYLKTIFDEHDAKGATGPIQLPGATSAAFESLLHALYPRKFGKTEISSVDEWTSVLDLATKWGFADARALATERLAASASPIEKIALARAHGLGHWLEDAYAAVCARREPLTLDEMRQLALEDVAKICAAREAAARGARGAADAQRQHPAPPCPAHDPVLPTAAAVEAVRGGLALLGEQDPGARQRGHAGIVDAVRRSDKRGDTLHAVLSLVVQAGMNSAPGDGARYAAVCEAIGEVPGVARRDDPFPGAQPLVGKKAVASYIASICEDTVDHSSVAHATTSDAPMRQAGFCADLFAKKLVNVKSVSGWWASVGHVNEVDSRTNVRSYCRFLSDVGHLIDLPKALAESGHTFLKLSRYADRCETSEIRSEIQNLIELRKRGWSKS